MPRRRPRYEDLTPRRRRKLQALLLARSALVGVLLFAAYCLLPLNQPEDIGLLFLIGGLTLIGVVIALQVHAILKSPFPRVRGLQTLITGIPLLLVVFAAVFYLTGQAEPGSFSEPMDKISAMYFTVTVFSTVGFGDITAKTDVARSLVTIQMMFDLVIIGLAAKVVFGAVTAGLQNQSAQRDKPASVELRQGVTPNDPAGSSRPL